jgi:hypothetical protein
MPLPHQPQHRVRRSTFHGERRLRRVERNDSIRRLHPDPVVPDRLKIVDHGPDLRGIDITGCEWLSDRRWEHWGLVIGVVHEDLTFSKDLVLRHRLRGAGRAAIPVVADGVKEPVRQLNRQERHDNGAEDDHFKNEDRDRSFVRRVACGEANALSSSGIENRGGEFDLARPVPVLCPNVRDTRVKRRAGGRHQPAIYGEILHQRKANAIALMRGCRTDRLLQSNRHLAESDKRDRVRSSGDDRRGRHRLHGLAIVLR